MTERVLTGQNGEFERSSELIEYRGDTFKSRIEVRWAFIYHQLGIRYKYEAEQFDFGSEVLYTPDFYLQDFDFYIEIKDGNFDDLAKLKAMLLSQRTGKRVYVFDGIQMTQERQAQSQSAYLYYQGNQVGSQHRWCECYRCRKLSIEELGDERNIKCRCTKNLWERKMPNQGRVHDAMEMALQIQFIDLENGNLRVDTHHPYITDTRRDSLGNIKLKKSDLENMF